MFNIKKVKRLEKELDNAKKDCELFQQRIDWYIQSNRILENDLRFKSSTITLLQSKIDHLGLYRDSKGRFQSIDTQL